MDINGQRYFLLREPDDFYNRSSRMLWHPQRRALTLAQNQLIRLPASNPSDSLELWKTVTPLAFDKVGQQARIDGNTLQFNAGQGFRPLLDDDLKPVKSTFGVFEDITLGGDDLLAATYSNTTDQHGVVLFHLRQRWQRSLKLPQRCRRVCIDSVGTVWCMGDTKLFACQGKPLPHDYTTQSDRFEPISVNPTPFSVRKEFDFNDGDTPLALCCDEHSIHILAHAGLNNQVILSRPLELRKATWQRFSIDSNDCPFAIDIQLISTDRFALMAPAQANDTAFRQRDCLVVQLQRDETHSAVLVRERYPMLSQAVPRFIACADKKVRYQAEVESDSDAASAGYSIYPRELLPLPRPLYYAAAAGTLIRELDSGSPQTIWHRLYLEGCIPSGCRVRIFAKAFNSLEQRANARFIEQPQWLWCRHRSDVGFGQGLVANRENESGLFELLLQRDKGPVRRLCGRYLQIRVVLEGDGRTAPSIHALKVYYPRFSYQESYLPEHFRQEYSVDPTLDSQPANGADVRERMLAAFEGALTPIETQIASAETLLSAQQTPDQHLSWLAEAFGQQLPDSWPIARKRRWLDNSGYLQRWRGTLSGVQMALDIVTDGAVQNGEVVVVENFRLRRTIATILGLNMDDSDHPLTLGTGVSGNSIVGESLILSDADAREFLSLFAPEIANAEETEVVAEFFDKYAHRVTVLLHGRARQLRDSVNEMLNEQMPAHLKWQLVETDHPFVLGLSPLLSVDTFIESQPASERVTLDQTWLGKQGVLTNIAAFSPQNVNNR